MKIVIDLNKITLDDFDVIMRVTDQTDASTGQQVKEQLWRFLVNDDNSVPSEQEARAFIGKVGLLDAMQAVKQMTLTLKQIMDDAVPPEKPSSS